MLGSELETKAIIMKRITILSIFLILIQDCFTQIPIEQYKTEIYNLKTVNEIELYWNKLYEIDQKKLIQEQDFFKSDSLSLDLMIRTVLLFQIHDTIGYNRFQNVLPVLNLIHSNLSSSLLIYWPIIEKCSALGGAINKLGGNFPAYELEGVSICFYNYSLLNQEMKYPRLMNKLSGKDADSIVSHLSSFIQKQKAIYRLYERKVIGCWFNQPFTNLKEESYFEIIEMSDGNQYIKNNNRLQKLNETILKSGNSMYRIEDEPFGWAYSLDSTGHLELLDETGEILIRYSKATSSKTN